MPTPSWRAEEGALRDGESIYAVRGLSMIVMVITSFCFCFLSNVCSALFWGLLNAHHEKSQVRSRHCRASASPAHSSVWASVDMDAGARLEGDLACAHQRRGQSGRCVGGTRGPHKAHGRRAESCARDERSRLCGRRVCARAAGFFGPAMFGIWHDSLSGPCTARRVNATSTVLEPPDECIEQFGWAIFLDGLTCTLLVLLSAGLVSALGITSMSRVGRSAAAPTHGTFG